MTPIRKWENLRYLIKKWASDLPEIYKNHPCLHQQKMSFSNQRSTKMSNFTQVDIGISLCRAVTRQLKLNFTGIPAAQEKSQAIELLFLKALFNKI
jgi:hypothetical protein